ncbi:MAG: hypothetical protein RLZZ292_3290 [Bacteroidota bacterium]|jgi:tetratricopeptide (TPR) repeat protein
MSPLRPPFQKDIYRDFKRIEVGALRTVVYYYEQYQTAIEQLDEEEYLEMTIDYAQALYELQWYPRFLTVVDKTLELIIMHNVYTYQGENLFEKMLFQKGVASIEKRQYDDGIKVLQELLKINPSYPFAYKTIQKAYFFQNPVFSKPIRISIIGLSLFTTLWIVVELLVVHSFYSNYESVFQYIRIGLTAFIILLFFGSILWYFARVAFRSKTVLNHAKEHYNKKKQP